LTAAGTVTITGYAWIDNQQSFYYENPSAEAASNKITLRIANATLVGPDDSEEILERLSRYYDQRYEKQMSLTPSHVKIGDPILTDALFDHYVLGGVERFSADLNGFISEVSSVGFPVVARATRSPRTGVAFAGSSLTRNNRFRERNFSLRSA